MAGLGKLSVDIHLAPRALRKVAELQSITAKTSRQMTRLSAQLAKDQWDRQRHRLWKHHTHEQVDADHTRRCDSGDSVDGDLGDFE